MTGRRPRRKGSAQKSKPAARKKSARPALGNDPFERGAAVREPAPPSVVPAAAVGASAARAEPRPPPTNGDAAERAERAPAALVEPPPAPTFLRDAAALRARLGALESRVESAAASASSRLRELALQEASGEHARELLEAGSRLLPALRGRLASVAALRDLFSARRPLDAFGMDEDLFRRLMPLLEFLYASWWRIEARQIENVPADGPVVLVANHGGALPWDALVLRLALLRDHPARRDLRPLLDDHALRLPVAGTVASRLGAVPATPENALRLLDAGGVVATFPEGSRAARRPWTQRYRIERFGRGGFAKLALRTGGTIVPCAIVGSEETSAPFGREGWLADALRMPFLAAAPALPLAPLELLPLPSRWSLRFGEPIETRAAGAAAADDAARVLDLTERSRASLQQMLDEDVASRRSVYL